MADSRIYSRRMHCRVWITKLCVPSKLLYYQKKIIPAECGSQNCVCSQNYCITQKNNSILTTLSSAFTCVSNLILKKPWQLFWLPHWVFHRVADFLKQVSWSLYETRQPPTMSISYRPKPSQKMESLVYYFIFTHQISVTLFSLRPGHGIWELTINSMLIERSCTQLSLFTHHIERQWKLSTKCVKNINPLRGGLQLPLQLSISFQADHLRRHLTTHYGEKSYRQEKQDRGYRQDRHNWQLNLTF